MFWFLQAFLAISQKTQFHARNRRFKRSKRAFKISTALSVYTNRLVVCADCPFVHRNSGFAHANP